MTQKDEHSVFFASVQARPGARLRIRDSQLHYGCCLLRPPVAHGMRSVASSVMRCADGSAVSLWESAHERWNYRSGLYRHCYNASN